MVWQSRRAYAALARKTFLLIDGRLDGGGKQARPLNNHVEESVFFASLVMADRASSSLCSRRRCAPLLDAWWLAKHLTKHSHHSGGQRKILMWKVWQ